MVRLILEKMEIHTEADDIDEDEEENKFDKIFMGVKDIGWSSPNLRYSLIKQASVIDKWKALTKTE